MKPTPKGGIATHAEVWAKLRWDIDRHYQAGFRPEYAWCSVANFRNLIKYCNLGVDLPHKLFLAQVGPIRVCGVAVLPAKGLNEDEFYYGYCKNRRRRKPKPKSKCTPKPQNFD